MALKAMRENLDGLDEKESQHYVEKDDKFYLAVTKVDGLGLENISGLKSTVEKLRASEKSLQTELKTTEDALKSAQTVHKEYTAKYDGIDAEQARSALGKIAEIQDWDGETKVKEAVQLAVTQVEQKAQTKLSEVVKQNTLKVEGLQNDLADSQSQLQEAIVTTKIIEAISKENGNVEVLMPHVRNQVAMVKDTHGKWRPEVQKADGTPRIGDSAGNDMTIGQLIQEMKSQDIFAGCFSGTNSSGTGKQTDSENTSHRKTTDNVKVIASSDDKAMSNNLDDIASGKTQVSMDA